jgi:hypothetical protein
MCAGAPARPHRCPPRQPPRARASGRTLRRPLLGKRRAGRTGADGGGVPRRLPYRAPLPRRPFLRTSEPRQHSRQQRKAAALTRDRRGKLPCTMRIRIQRERNRIGNAREVAVQALPIHTETMEELQPPPRPRPTLLARPTPLRPSPPPLSPSASPPLRPTRSCGLWL